MNTIREITFCLIYFGVHENLKVNLAHIEYSILSRFLNISSESKYTASPLAILIAGTKKG